MSRVHRRPLTALTALAVSLAAALGLPGCGAEREIAAPAQSAPGQATPAPAPAPASASGPLPADAEPKLEVPAAVARRLAGGGIAVVDLANRAAIEPASLRPNSEQVLRGMRWSGWGSPRAVGRGTVRTLECEPSCAGGLVHETQATLTLSAPRVCGERRFYGEARLVVEGEGKDAGEGGLAAAGPTEPATYLRTPC